MPSKHKHGKKDDDSKRDGDSRKNGNIYDIIIVGAGTAGCALARILHDRTTKRILLIEQGLNQQEDPNIRSAAGIFIPPEFTNDGKIGGLYGDDNKYYMTTLTRPNPAYAQRKLLTIRGNQFGGSSSVHYLLAVRGGPVNYQKWTDATGGSKYWTVFNIFTTAQRLETYVGQTQHPRSRGTDGPVHILQNDPSQDSPANAPLLTALAKTPGYPRVVIVPDYNANIELAGSAEWQTWLELNPDHTVTRSSSDYAYLNNATLEMNAERTIAKTPDGRLTILFEAGVDQILFNGNKAIGVRTLFVNELVDFFANDLVVLTANLSDIPLLQRSGVGDPELLTRLNIPIVSPNRAVGRNLMDHPHVGIVARTNIPGAFSGNQPIVYVPYPNGGGYSPNERAIELLALNAAQFSPTLLFTPEVVILEKEKFAGYDHLGLVVNISPRSQEGHAYINNRQPITDFTMFTYDLNIASNPVDIDVLVHGVRRYADAIRQIGGVMLFPDQATVDDDASLREFIQANGQHQEHHTSGVRMGLTNGTQTSGSTYGDAVDPFLNVYGTENLKVADVMISPFIPSNHTGNTALIIGNIAAQIIIDELNAKQRDQRNQRNERRNSSSSCDSD